MQGSWSPHDFPGLNEISCRITSPLDKRYNCTAWAAGMTNRNWWPDPWGIGYWPPDAPRVATIGAFVKAYETLGYALCSDDSSETGIEKIAIFGIRGFSGEIVPTHAARQLESGDWTSKLGDFEDIAHVTVDAVAGSIYGDRICCMARPRQTNP